MGGGIYVGSGAELSLINTVVSSNTADSYALTYLYCEETFSGTATATTVGGGVYLDGGGSVELVNVVIDSNTMIRDSLAARMGDGCTGAVRDYEEGGGGAIGGEELRCPLM